MATSAQSWAMDLHCPERAGLRIGFLLCVRWMVLLLTVAVASRGLSQAPSLPLMPAAIAYDAAGNLYIADAARNEVFESTVGGQLAVIAGSGVQGFSGDGGPATAAEFNAPQGIAVGADGTIYIADTGNERIRAINGAGVITTIAGNGTAGFAGDGGAATAAEVDRPLALAVDASGDLLIADSGNERVRRVASGVMTTIAGSGVQGFAGDGAAATAAALDTPAGLAVSSSGEIFIADSHNNRVRAVAADGTISTIAGTGASGYAGDGGAATSAELASPRGLALLSDGTLLVADANNQRLRAISPSGMISTVVGNGVQGPSAEGTAVAAAEMNEPRSAAVSAFAAPVYGDMGNRLVRALLSNDAVYSAAGLVSGRTSTVTLSAPGTAVYGTSSVAATVQGVAATPQGTVAVEENGSVLAQGALAQGAATIALPALAAGNHSLTVSYMGDGFNPAAQSSDATMTVTPAPVVAIASAATMTYGAPMPALTGTLSGVLPQDANSLSASFNSTATSSSPVGPYPITAALSGTASSNYALTMSPSSGELTITPASSVTTLTPASSAYAGLPLTLTATVASSTTGTPTGTVSFSDSGNVLATETLLNGSATAIDLAPSAGDHSFTASYSGNANFLPSETSASVVAVSALPDFTLSANGSASQTVQYGTVAVFSINVSAQQGPFTGAVSLAASGLPTGAVATFSPASVVPGTTSAVTQMSVATEGLLPSSTSQVQQKSGSTAVLALTLALPLLLAARKRRLLTVVAGWIAIFAAFSISGCGARTVLETSANSQAFTITVTGTGTNLAGNVVSHSMQVKLMVE